MRPPCAHYVWGHYNVRGRVGNLVGDVANDLVRRSGDRGGEDHVAVDGGVNRIHRTGETVVGHLSDLGGSGLAEASVGRHDPQGRVLSTLHKSRRLHEMLYRVGECTVLLARSG